MTFRAEPVTDGNAALITALDRTLSWLRPHDRERADNLVSEVFNAFATADGHKRLEGVERFTDIVLELLDLAQTSGSLTGLMSVNGEESKEVTKSFSEICPEMEEVLMTFISACDEDVDALSRLVKRIKDGKTFSDVRLRTLMYAFNAQPATSPAKATLFLDVVNFSISVNLLDVAVVPVLKKAEQWPLTWSISNEKRHEIYSIVADSLLAIDQQTLAYNYLCRAVELANVSASEQAASCLRMAIVSPTQFYFDKLLGYNSIKKLEELPEYKPLWTVGNILLKGSVQEMSAAFTQYPELTNKYKLNETGCMRKIRVIAVANEAVRMQRTELGQQESLCTKRILKLSDLAKIVGFSEEETEEACVSGVGHGLFAAKLDQLNKTIEIDSAMCRDFVVEDWKFVRNKLKQWRSGLEEMHSLLTKA